MTFLEFLLLALAALAATYVSVVVFFHLRHPEPHWNWDAIDTSDIAFPPGFIWGVASSAHQVEGGCTSNNWSRWEESTGPDGTPRIARGQKAGRACDHWNRYREDIQLIKDLGVTAYRFSLEWSKIEPAPGQFDGDAIAHYHQVIDALHQAGISPVLTLHHFTHPAWFEEMGSFENAGNLDHFVRFAGRMFAEFHDAGIALWCTINEPEVFATVGWSVGRFPPGKKDPQLTAQVLANLLTAHARVYTTIKAMPGGDRAQVGLVKSIFQFDPLRRHHLLDWLATRVLDRVFNRAILDCLTTGRFRIHVPGMIAIDQAIPDMPATLDFIGLNYYSHTLVRCKASRNEPFTLAQRPGDIQTDMPYPIYAEGFHRALHEIARLGWPIHVTENGIADVRDDRRALYIQRYLHALHRAMQEGVDVRGYFYWSLMDNFEWAEGYDMKFGLYAMDPATLERTLRPGARAYTAIVGKHRGSGHAQDP